MTTQTFTSRARKTYWKLSPRGFANEFRVAVATTPLDSAVYLHADGWVQVSRKRALYLMRYDGDASTEAFTGCEVNGRSWESSHEHLVQLIEDGEDVSRWPRNCFGSSWYAL